MNENIFVDKLQDKIIEYGFPDTFSEGIDCKVGKFSINQNLIFIDNIDTDILYLLPL